MRATTKRGDLIVRGDANYAPGGKARIAFADLTPIGAGLNTAIRGVELIADLLVTHDNAGSLALPEVLAFRIFEKLELRTPGGHVYIDLPTQAGSTMRALLHAMAGKLPEAHGGGGNITLPTAANTAVTVALYLPIGLLIGGVEPDDANVDLADLLESALVVGWANGAAGGIFDTGADNERIVSGSLRCKVDMVGRREQYRGGVRLTIAEQRVAGPAERLPIVDEVLVWLLERPRHTDGSLTPAVITAAGRTRVTLRDGAHTLVDAEAAADRSKSWNATHGAARADYLPRHETGATPWLMLFGPGQRPFKVTHLPAPEKHPQLQVEGTDTTPTVAWVSAKLHNAAIVQDRATKAKVDPRRANRTKTFSKNDAGDDLRGVVQRLPFVVE